MSLNVQHTTKHTSAHLHTNDRTLRLKKNTTHANVIESNAPGTMYRAGWAGASNFATVALTLG